MTPEEAHEVAVLVRMYRRRSEEIGRLEEMRAEIKARLASLLDVGATGVVDGVGYEYRPPNRRFDVSAAVALLPSEVVVRCAATGLDTSKLREAAKAAGVLEDAMLTDPNAAPVLRLQ